MAEEQEVTAAIIDNEVIGVDKALFNQIEPGDTCIFTLQNGFFNFPVIKDKSFD